MTDKDLYQIANQAGEALLRRQQTLAVAESCTGGWIGQTATAIAGSSRWFERGFVTYSNAAKIQMLAVPEAGPGGGSKEKPVGTVWIAWAGPGDICDSQRFNFPGDREAVRRASVISSWQGLLERLA